MLAAGGSRRLGRPKQLLPWRGSTLIRHAARIAIESGIGPVVVMLGANASECADALAGEPALEIVTADNWSEGMGATIAAAVAHLVRAHPGSTAVLLTACDQPFLTATHLSAIREAHVRQRTPMAAAAYAGTLGIPAAFSRPLFPDLISLHHERGAAELLRAEPGLVAAVPCPEADRDIDTPEDLEVLN